LKTFFIDFFIAGTGTLTSYVEAEDSEQAKLALQCYLEVNNPEFVNNKVEGVYAIEEIPCDYPYIGPHGEAMVAKADQNFPMVIKIGD
jgi:hypothetical protein